MNKKKFLELCNRLDRDATDIVFDWLTETVQDDVIFQLELEYLRLTGKFITYKTL